MRSGVYVGEYFGFSTIATYIPAQFAVELLRVTGLALAPCAIVAALGRQFKLAKPERYVRARASRGSAGGGPMGLPPLTT
jgi:hypothetical protein